MVTRAMGDGYLKKTKLSQAPFKDHCPYITSTPEIHKLEIHDDDAFVVLASDGIWDLLQNEEVVQIVGEALSRKQGQVDLSLDPAGPPHLAQLVVDAALQKVCEDHLLTRSELDRLSFGAKRRKLHDDMTVVVVCLDKANDARCDTTLKSTGADACSVPSPTVSKKSDETSARGQAQQLTMNSMNNGEQGDEPASVKRAADPLVETTMPTLAMHSTAALGTPKTSLGVDGVATAPSVVNSIESVAPIDTVEDSEQCDGETGKRVGVLPTDWTGNKRDVAVLAPASTTGLMLSATDTAEPLAKRARDTSLISGPALDPSASATSVSAATPSTSLAAVTTC
eukprot:COSAG02_NODE_6742_length_3390_cov_2.876937_2_plen_339_part_00